MASIISAYGNREAVVVKDGKLLVWVNNSNEGSCKINLEEIKHPTGKKWESVSSKGYCTAAIDDSGSLWIC